MAGIVQKSLEYLGFASESAPGPVRSNEATARQLAPRVTPLRSVRRGSDVTEIHTIEPKSYQEAREVAEYFRVGIPVIVNMAELSEADARRMLDFMLGLKEGLMGHLKRVTPKVFLLTPETVGVNEEDHSMFDATTGHTAPSATVADDLLVRPF